MRQSLGSAKFDNVLIKKKYSVYGRLLVISRRCLPNMRSRYGGILANSSFLRAV